MSSLAEKIAARLHQALDHHQHAGTNAPAAERGVAVGRPDDPVIVLSVDDVARIASLVITDNGVASHPPTPDTTGQQSWPTVS